MKKLELKDLHVEVDGKEIIKGVSLIFEEGQAHALMGPNGAGKSTLAYAVMGHPRYKITSGQIILDGKDITYEKPDARARAGIFLSFQHPQSYEGITISKFLRQATIAVSGKNLTVMEFNKMLKEKMALLKINPEFGRRYLNKGFSGGEKKRMEVLQLLLLQPRFAFLDETDSGLDVDAIKIVAEGINMARKDKKMSVILITHYHKFLSHFNPDKVSVIYEGKIAAQGGQELARQIEEEGFEPIIKSRKYRIVNGVTKTGVKG